MLVARSLVFVIIASLFVSGCSAGGVAPVSATPAPTSTPTPAPTPTPIAGPPMGNIACRAGAQPVPGTYTAFGTTGNVVGTTYVMDPHANNNFVTTSYDPAPTGPTPTPGPSGTPDPLLPTPAPVPPPSPSPTPVPPGVQTTYYGTYVIPPGSSTGSTSGCFNLVVERPTTPTGASDNSAGLGTYTLAPPGEVTTALASEIVSLQIRDLTPTTGDGAITLPNGTSGTITITGSVARTTAVRTR